MQVPYGPGNSISLNQIGCTISFHKFSLEKCALCLRHLEVAGTSRTNLNNGSQICDCFMLAVARADVQETPAADALTQSKS